MLFCYALFECIARLTFFSQNSFMFYFILRGKMIIQCYIVATCSNGLVIQAKYLTESNTLPVKKIKACYDSKLSLKDNAISTASLLQLANRQTLKQWQCNILECSETVLFTQDVTINSVKF